jgi:hypothetical protein
VVPRRGRARERARGRSVGSGRIRPAAVDVGRRLRAGGRGEARGTATFNATGITLPNGNPGTAPPQNHQTQVVLTSTDGASWTVTPLAEIERTANVDSASSVIEWVAVGTDNVLVTATNQSASAVHDRSITFVGTPVAS